jgi:hypothetical protein
MERFCHALLPLSVTDGQRFKGSGKRLKRLLASAFAGIQSPVSIQSKRKRR